VLIQAGTNTANLSASGMPASSAASPKLKQKAMTPMKSRICLPSASMLARSVSAAVTVGHLQIESLHVHTSLSVLDATAGHRLGVCFSGRDLNSKLMAGPIPYYRRGFVRVLQVRHVATLVEDVESGSGYVPL
jgi:hypothetical protein